MHTGTTPCHYRWLYLHTYVLYKPIYNHKCPFHGAPIAQSVEHDIGNIRVINSSPDLGTSRNGQHIHSAVK